MKIEHNTARIKHLLKMYRLSVPDFLEKISSGLKNPITEKDVFGEQIKLPYLKRIDKLFEKGLHYYLDPKAPDTSKESSVFFRKESFNTESLSIGAVKVVNAFEDLKHSLSAIIKLSELRLDRKIKTYTIHESSETSADELRPILYPEFHANRRDFLKALIAKMAGLTLWFLSLLKHGIRRKRPILTVSTLNPI